MLEESVSDHAALQPALMWRWPCSLNNSQQGREAMEATADHAPGFGDERGWFFDWNQRKFDDAAGEAVLFSQDNHCVRSRCAAGCIPARTRTARKLVRATVGAIFDVAVDIRRGSPTFGPGWARTECREQVPAWDLRVLPTVSHPQHVAECSTKRGGSGTKCERAIVWNTLIWGLPGR